MNSSVTRRGFMAAGAVGTASLLSPQPSTVLGAPSSTNTKSTGITLPHTEPALAKEIVLVSHFNVKRVGELLKDDRSLALSSWDWGFGDWETALGAASHMGRRDIAEALLDHGARPNLFTFAMLDMVEAVRAVCESSPGIQKTRGPHGITLLTHAEHGKAKRVVAYLQKLGDADNREPNMELSDDQCSVYLGEYEFDGGGTDRLIVRKRKDSGIGILRTGDDIRSLRRTGEHVFSPQGAPHVSVRFSVKDGQAVGLTIHRGRPILSAKRVEG